MPAGTDRYRMPSPDLLKRIADIESRLGVLERVPQLGTTTIDRGTLRVRDNNDSVRVQVGLLSDGSYGVESKETGQENFHQPSYTFAMQVAAFEGLSGTSFARLATVGPYVTVPVRSSGRVFISISAQIQWPANPFTAGPLNEGGSCTFQATGANLITLAQAINIILCGRGWVWQLAGGATMSDTQLCMVTHQGVIEGLSPGNTLFEVVYRSHSANTTEFGLRTLSVTAL